MRYWWVNQNQTYRYEVQGAAAALRYGIASVEAPFGQGRQRARLSWCPVGAGPPPGRYCRNSTRSGLLPSSNAELISRRAVSGSS